MMQNPPELGKKQRGLEWQDRISSKRSCQPFHPYRTRLCTGVTLQDSTSSRGIYFVCFHHSLQYITTPTLPIKMQWPATHWSKEIFTLHYPLHFKAIKQIYLAIEENIKQQNYLEVHSFTENKLQSASMQLLKNKITGSYYSGLTVLRW